MRVVLLALVSSLSACSLTVPDLTSGLDGGPGEVPFRVQRVGGSHGGVGGAMGPPQRTERLAEVGEGNLLIAYVYWLEASPVLEVTDDRGGTWRAVPTVNPVGRSGFLQFWYARALAAGPRAVTVRMPPSFVGLLGLSVLEYRGLSGAQPLGASATQLAPAGSRGAASTPEVATFAPNALLLAAFVNPVDMGRIRLGASFSEVVFDEGFYMSVGERVVGPGRWAASAQMPNPDDNWVAQLVAFEPGP